MREGQEHLGRGVHGHDDRVVVASSEPCTDLLDIVQTLSWTGSSRTIGHLVAIVAGLLQRLALIDKGIGLRVPRGQSLCIVACGPATFKLFAHFHNYYLLLKLV